MDFLKGVEFFQIALRFLIMPLQKMRPRTDFSQYFTTKSFPWTQQVCCNNFPIVFSISSTPPKTMHSASKVSACMYILLFLQTATLLDAYLFNTFFSCQFTNSSNPENNLYAAASSLLSPFFANPCTKSCSSEYTPAAIQFLLDVWLKTVSKKV